MLILAACPVIQVNYPPLNSLILKIEIALLLLCTLLFLLSFPRVFLPEQTLLVVDGVDEEGDLRILPKHLILKVAPRIDDSVYLLLREQFLLGVEVQLVEHVLHDLVDFVCHFRFLNALKN